MNLEIGGGTFNRTDWINLDICPSADVIHDLNILPWPIPDNQADQKYSSHCIEHVKNPYDFLYECARIGKIGCNVEIRCPAPFSDLAMTAGHIHVFSPQQAINIESHFPELVWGGKEKRLKLISYKIQPTERLAEAKAELPFLKGLSDAIILKYISGTAHDVIYFYNVQINEFKETSDENRNRWWLYLP
jgi:hypothetical protein